METRASRLSKQAENKNKLEGYAATFNNPTQITDARGRVFNEVIRPGAFSKAIDGGDVRALVNHDTAKLLARQKSGTLRLKEREQGLWFSLDLPETEAAREVKELVQRGDLDGMSFGWMEATDKWSTQDKMPMRELINVSLQEVSVVTFPAYTQTSVEIRSDGLWLHKLKLLRATIDIIE